MTQGERYASLRARKVCVDCARRKAKPGRARCRACLRAVVRHSQEWQRRNRRHVREVARRRMESLYWSNPHAHRTRMKERRLTKKLNGICRDCPNPSLEDSVLCRRCRDRNRASSRKHDAKRRARLRREAAREIRTYKPLAEVIDLTRVRLLRAARTADWSTFDDLFDILGGGDERQRNTTAKMLERLTKAGRFERRRAIRGLNGGYGVRWEYLITSSGLAELESVLRRVRSPGTRRAA